MAVGIARRRVRGSYPVIVNILMIIIINTDILVPNMGKYST